MTSHINIIIKKYILFICFFLRFYVFKVVFHIYPVCAMCLFIRIEHIPFIAQL